MPDYRFKTIPEWKAFVKTLTTEDDLNEAHQLLLRNPDNVVHPFAITSQVGLAIWHLDFRAADLGGYRLKSKNEYRIPKAG